MPHDSNRPRYFNKSRIGIPVRTPFAAQPGANAEIFVSLALDLTPRIGAPHLQLAQPYSGRFGEVNMKPLKATYQLGLFGGLGLLLLATACGPTQFSDKAALTIQGTPPAPPPPPPEEPAKPMRVEMRDNSIVINEKIQFAYNDSTILEVSYSLLDEVADVIKNAPHVKKIEIGGHASTEGSDSHNKTLSQARAKSVKEYLIEKGGVAADKLTSVGYGEEKPLISPEETEADREKNRRVEFLILEQDVTQKKVQIDPNTGKEKIVATSVKTKTKEPKQTAATEEEAAPAEESK